MRHQIGPTGKPFNAELGFFYDRRNQSLSLREFINSRGYLHPLKEVFRPLMIAINGRMGEEAWLKLISDNLNKPDITIYDVGSSNGWFLKRSYPFFPNSFYYHFEPRADALNDLRKISGSLGSKSKFYNIALSNFDEGKAIFYVRSHKDASSLVNNKLWMQSSFVDEINVDLRSLDGVTAESKVKSIDLLKIDVEGAELQVLLGARKTLEHSVNNVILEVSPLRHENGSAETIEVITIMLQAGFSWLDTSENNIFFSKDKLVCEQYTM